MASEKLRAIHDGYHKAIDVILTAENYGFIDLSAEDEATINGGLTAFYANIALVDAGEVRGWQAHSGEDYSVVMLPDENTECASISVHGDDREALAIHIANCLNHELLPAAPGQPQGETIPAGDEHYKRNAASFERMTGKQPDTIPVPAELRIEDDDHVRGCQGRYSGCTCGYDEKVDAELRRLHSLINVPADVWKQVVEAVEAGLNYIQNSEAEFDIKLNSGDRLRKALAAAKSVGVGS